MLDAAAHDGGELDVQMDTDDGCSMSVKVVAGQKERIGSLFDIMACRGSTGRVRLHVSGVTPAARDMHAWTLWVQGAANLELNLPKCELGPHGVRLLSEYMFTDHVLDIMTRIDLQRNDIGPDGLGIITERFFGTRQSSSGDNVPAEQFTRIPNMMFINLRHNNTGSEAYNQLYKMLPTLWPGVKAGEMMKRFNAGTGNQLLPEDVLDLYRMTFNKYLHNFPTDEEIMHFTKLSIVETVKSFGYFHLWDLPWLNEYWGFMASRVAKSSATHLVGVKRITAINCGLRDSNVKHLNIYWMGGNPSPEPLIFNIRHNQISDTGGEILSQDLGNWCIDTLHIEHNMLTQDGKNLLLKAWVASGKEDADGRFLRGLYV